MKFAFKSIELENNHTRKGKPGLKRQILYVFSYMWMLASDMYATIWIITEVMYLGRDQRRGKNLPGRGK